MSIEELNLEQDKAVKHIEGPMLVLAGAGSGKTRVVTKRVAYLLSLGIPASSILAVTFTNKAAQEMRERIEKLTKQHVLTCTFHSLAARILRASITTLGYSPHFTIYDEDDSNKLLKECLVTLNTAPEKKTLKTIKSQISQAKNDLIGPEEIPFTESLLRQCYTLYQKQLKTAAALDFDDLLFLTVKLFETSPSTLKTYQNTWQYLLIDEYQDTNLAQYKLIQLLAAPENNLFVVGDPDQSIYSWRGARVQNILNFSHDFPGAKITTLEQNYRSRARILNAANSLIANNQSRYEKQLWSARGEGDLISLCYAEDDKIEAYLVVQKILNFQKKHHCPLQECAIFYRTNAQSRTFEDALLQRKIPYTIVGGLSFYERKEIKDLLCFLRIVSSGTDPLSFMRTINLPKRGFGESAIGKVRAASEERSLPIFESCQAICRKDLPCQLSKKQLEGLKEYVDLIQSVREALHSKAPLHQVISFLIEKSGYLEVLKEDPETYQDRRENVAQLVSKAAENQENDLSLFLEEISLRSSFENSSEEKDLLRLMTLHNSKGLEFSFVALVGLEEGLLPYAHALDDEQNIEEERRLCYVGMTRAKETLCLSTASSRYLWGTKRAMRPSRFLNEIPRKFLSIER